MEPTVISTRIRHSSLPESYVRPVSDRPNLSQVSDCENVPIIDLGCKDRSLIIYQIPDACQQYGFFQNRFASDDEGNYEGLTEAIQKSSEARQKSFEAAMKQNIDNKKVNDEHVVDMPKGPDHNNKKEQANDGLFRLCEIGLANTVSLMGSNPPPWATTPASQGLLGFSGAANAVGYVGTTAALSLRYTKPGAARIFANVGPIGCAWGVIMGFNSYLPGEFQWLGYVAAVFCTLAVLLANY